MKTIKILGTALLISISYLAMAQQSANASSEEVQFRIKAGLNYSNVYDSQDESFDADGKFGLAGGAVLYLPLNEYFGVQPEILFSQKGFKGTGTLLGSEYSFKRTTSYIDIPIQFALKPSEIITIVLGPQYSYLISQKDEFVSSFASYAQEQAIDNDNIRKNILGFVVGFDIHQEKITIGGRMGWDMQNNNGNGTSDTPRYKNAWMQATLGYTLFN